jgi:hypothetical protein
VSAPVVTDPEQLTRYLLGELTPDEETELDARLLADDDQWAALRQAEDDLVDAYALGRLGGARRARAAARIAASPRLGDRVAFARSLHAIAARPAARSSWSARAAGWLTTRNGRLALVGVGVAALLLAIVWPRGEPAPPTIVASLVLEPPTRSARVPTLVIPATGAVELTVVLDPEELCPAYRLRVVGARGAVVWSREDARGRGDGVAAVVPTGVLPAGAYALEVIGVRADQEVALGSRDFRVTTAAR